MDGEMIDVTTGGTPVGSDVNQGGSMTPADDGASHEPDDEITPDAGDGDEGQDTSTGNSNGTPEGGEAQGFTSVDPSSLPEQLQPIYKQMQADYTRKTQEIAETRKAAEAYQRFRPHLDRIFSDPKLTNMVFGFSDQGDGNPAPAETPQPQEIPDDPREFAKYVQEQTLTQVQEMLQAQERERQVEVHHAQDRAAAEKLDDRLNSDPEFAQTIAQLVLGDAQYTGGQKSAVQATKDAISRFDAYTRKVAKTAQQQLVDKAKNKPLTAGSGGSSRGTSGGETISSMMDAWKAAEAESAS